MSVTILIRGGTAAEWTAADPILHAREMGLETDTQKFKFGDGVTAWSGLPYAGATGGGTVTDVTATAPLASSGGATPDISITLPADASKYLDGTGAFTTPAGGGTVTDVTASAPLASSGGTTPDISASDFDGTNSGLVPAGPADATKYLDGSGNFTVPAGSGGTVTDVTATAPVTSSGGATPDIAVPVFVASGASHASGLVPDPGASGGTTKFLREDATFQVPTGGGNVTSTGAGGSEPGSPSSGDLYFPNNGFNQERYSGSAWIPWGPLFPLTIPPDDSTWAWINQGSATTTQTTNNGIFLSSPAATLNFRIRKRSIGANTSVKAAFISGCFCTTDGGTAAGLVLREAGTGKLASFLISQGNNGAVLNIQHFSSPTAFVGNDVVNIFFGILNPVFLRVDFSGANLVYYASGNGQDWTAVATIAKTTQFTTAPDEWGFCVLNNTASAPAVAAVTLISWATS